MNDYINYYDLFGIDKNASNEDIKKAYRNLAKKWHPDLNKDPKAPEMAKKINEAKEILLDENKRKEYDNYLNNYKNDAYDNINKRQEQDGTKPSYTEEQGNNYEEKTYTKWEYFKLYLKYYKKSKPRKVLACILVFLETLLCLILDGINLLFAYLIAYFGYYLAILLLIGGILLIFLIIIKGAVNTSLPPNTSFDYIIMLASSVLSITFAFFIKNILNLFANIIPVKISKLNLFLFKKSIGYDKNSF